MKVTVTTLIGDKFELEVQSENLVKAFKVNSVQSWLTYLINLKPKNNMADNCN